MSREDRIIAKLEGSYDFIEFVNDNYPDVILQWNNKNGLRDQQSPEPTADINNPEPPGDVYTSG